MSPPRALEVRVLLTYSQGADGGRLPGAIRPQQAQSLSTTDLEAHLREDASGCGELSNLPA